MDVINRQRMIVFLFPLLLSLPFINRAYFVDDSYFVEIASWLKDNPSQPYHFRADDAGSQTRGWEEDGFVRMVNPLGHHYYMALLLKLGGEKEWFLRLGCLLLSCFTGFFIFELARRLTDHPFLAALMALATPAQWLTQHSLLIDATTGFGFMAALYFFIRGCEEDSIIKMIVSGLFMGFAIITKYPAVLILPLTATWTLLRWKKIRRRSAVIIPWALGLGILAAYSAWTAHLYGSPHIIAASQRMVDVYGWPKILVFFIFLSGVTFLPLISWLTAGVREAALAAIAVILSTLFFSSAFGGFSVIQGALISLWAVTSLLMLTQAAQSWREWVFPRDTFVVLWVVEFIAMMLVVMGWVAGRYYVIASPAVIFLVVRFIEKKWPQGSAMVLKLSLVGMLVGGGALAYADYQQAETSRRLIHDLKQQGFEGGPRHFYTGDSFTVSYLKGAGWTPSFDNTVFEVGDWVLAKEVTMPSISFGRQPISVREIAVFDYSARFPIKVMDREGSAGFYASVWGTLPFSWSSSPWERFHLFEVTGKRPS